MVEKPVGRKRFAGEDEVYQRLVIENVDLVGETKAIKRVKQTQVESTTYRNFRAEFLKNLGNLSGAEELEGFLRQHFNAGMKALPQKKIRLRKIMANIRKSQEWQKRPVLNRHAVDAIAILGFMESKRKEAGKE